MTSLPSALITIAPPGSIVTRPECDAGAGDVAGERVVQEKKTKPTAERMHSFSAIGQALVELQDGDVESKTVWLQALSA